MSLFSNEQNGQNLPLYDTRQTFETSESEPLPFDGSTEGSSESEDIVDIKKPMEHGAEESNEKNLKEILALNNENNNEGRNLLSVKSYEECKECNGKVMNDALSQENIQLLRNIKSREKKLKDTRRQLNEERAFYEQQKMDLCKTMAKKKSKSQIIQTDESGLEVNTMVQNMECQITILKKELEKQANKSSKLKEKCQNLRKRNGQLKSEISLNEEDYEKSWKEVRDKLEMYKKECGNAEKNSGIIKNVYDQVLKKNAYLARSNFTLQAELRRLYRKFEKIDKLPPIKRFTSKSTIPSVSNPDLWWRHRSETNQKRKKKMRRSKTAPGRSNADDSSENLVVSGSLISVHVEGEEKRLRPVFLVLDDAKRGYKKTYFGVTKDDNISDSSSMRQISTKNEYTQRIESATEELKQLQENKDTPQGKNIDSDINTLEKDEISEKTKNESTTKRDKNEVLTENKSDFSHKKKSKIKEMEPKLKEESSNAIEKHNSLGIESPRTFNNEIKIITQLQEVMENDNLDTKQKNEPSECHQTFQENSDIESDPQKIINNINETSLCSNSENCIIECRTHSSSVQ